MKIFFAFVIPMLLLSSQTKDKKEYEGKLNENQLKFIKENFNWKTGEHLIVNFRQPSNYCHYDNYKNLKNSVKWWSSFYSQLSLSKISNIFVYSDDNKAKNILDSEIHVANKDDFFLTHFFSLEKTCYAVMLIKENGFYYQKNGEYTQEEIIEYINKLNQN